MKLSPPSQALQIRERELARRIYGFIQQRETVQGLWEGVVPGLPHGLAGLRGARITLGLVARSDPVGGGEILVPDGGWSQVDPGTANIGIGSETEVVLLMDYPMRDAGTRQRTGDFRDHAVALVAMRSGQAPVAGSFSVWRLPQSTGNWTEVPFTTGTGNAIAANELRATVDGDILSGSSPLIGASRLSMPEAIVFSRGAPGSHRQGLSTDQAANGTIDQPCFIFTNNLDPVSVWPRANDVIEYEPLTDQFGDQTTPGTTNTCDFRCLSLEDFDDRVYFLNTLEYSGASPIRRGNRLRRTARGTCDPDPALVGSGFKDFDQFSGQGVKCKKLGDVLACYFEDGVAFVRRTGVPTAPNEFQTLNERRGLLSNSGLVSISDNEHFGVFDDGWWILDASGRWREAGVVSVNGKQIEKWRSFFDQTFNRALSAHRLNIHYDELHNWVRILIPTGAPVDDVRQEWIYDLDSDRLWTDQIATGVNCFGDLTITTDVAQTWATTTDLWSTIIGSWGSFEVASAKRLCHGDPRGIVFFHDDDFITREGAQPAWAYISMITDFDRPLSLKTSQRLVMEHINAENDTDVSLRVLDARGASAGENKPLDVGSPGRTALAQAHARVEGQHLGVQVSGVGPVIIRGLSLDWTEPQVEERIAP